MARTVAMLTFTSPQPLFDEAGQAVIEDGKHVIGPVTKVAFRGDFEQAERDVKGWVRDDPDAEGTVALVYVDETDTGTVDMSSVRTIPKAEGGRSTTIARDDAVSE